MFRRFSALLLILFLTMIPISSYAENDVESTTEWLNKLIAAFNEQEPTKAPVYGSLDDKACTAAYVELEYAFQNLLKEAKTDTYSIYFIVACVAANEIENTLFNPDSNIYGKVGRTEYQLSLNYLFGKNIDTESGSFKASMKYIRRYFMQESAEACAAFYDDLVEFRYIDENGVMNLKTQKFASELGISQGAVYAILEELNLYQSNPIDGLKK